ncbi:hypothetical protein JCGZ_11268 [Jatropha curcas]|uniref:Aminotransferase-like plant mobile domain-containing protein n=1 Tax=Jatropha curcas TaxID=180498 RepID=A0A067KF73_JATCU|nr:hypothetical protein JCGZ_11268 [Jatropha curcas]
MVKEILAVPRLDISPASLILHVFGFSAYKILSYDFGADVVPYDQTFTLLGKHAWYPSSMLRPMGSPFLLQVMAPPPDHLMFDCRPRVYVYRQHRLIGETVEDWTSIFQDLTSKGVRWTCPWWYIERVTVSFYMLCVPLYGLSMALAYYPSRVARQFDCHQAVPDYTQFDGGLLTQRFLSRFISS